MISLRFMSPLIGLLLLATSALVWPAFMQADQAQYFYDELGRLIGVVDGQGNVAVCNYDAVGNLLSIQRLTAGAGVGICVVAPSARVDITGVLSFEPSVAYAHPETETDYTHASENGKAKAGR